MLLRHVQLCLGFLSCHSKSISFLPHLHTFYTLVKTIPHKHALFLFCLWLLTRIFTQSNHVMDPGSIHYPCHCWNKSIHSPKHGLKIHTHTHTHISLNPQHHWQMFSKLQSDHVPHWMVFRGSAPVSGVLALQGHGQIFGWGVNGAVETESINKCQQEQEADDTKYGDDEDGVHLHVHLLQWWQRGGGRRSTETRRWSPNRKRRLHGGRVGDAWHDGRCGLSRVVGALLWL